MSEKEGFYFSVHEYSKGPSYQIFLDTVEKETMAWVQSDAGKAAIRRAVAETINKEITAIFGWGYGKDDPRAERFKSIVRDALFKELFRAVERET